MKYYFAIIALLGALLGALQLDAARKDGVTFDEVYHIPVGYVFLRGGPYFDRGHPPLARYVYALPLAFLPLTVDRDDPSWGLHGDGYGRRFLTQQLVPMRTIVMAARSMVIALSLVLALLIAAAARKRYGDLSGILAMMLCAGSPELIAHGHLATNDLAAALAIFCAVPALAYYAERPTFARALLGGAAIAIAFLTKFTAMTLAPMGVLLVLAYWLLHVRARPLRTLAWPIFQLGIFTFLLVILFGMIAFGFRRGSLAEDLQVMQSADPAQLRAALVAVTAKLAHLGIVTSPDALLHVRVPAYMLFKNVGFLIGRSVAPDLFTDGRAYMLGEYAARGFRTYFLMTFLLKSTLALVTLTLLAIAYAGVQRRPIVWRTWTLLIPIAVYGATCVGLNATIGHRHLLPLYPFLIVLVSSLAAAESRGVRRASLAIGALGIVAVLTSHPYELAYYNWLAGPSRDHWKRFTESNIDWGQDVPRLAAFQRAHSLYPLAASLSTSVTYADQGLDATEAPPDREKLDGWVAVSASHLLARRRGLHGAPDVEAWAWLRETPPVAKVGSGIFLYHFDHGNLAPVAIP